MFEQETGKTAEALLKDGEKLAGTLKHLSLQDALDKFTSGVVDFAFKLLIAIIVFYIGRFIITRLYRFIRKIMAARQTDASLASFILSLLRITLYFILIVTVIGILGIETSSFIALFASAGVAIGMALSGTLQNFAGGVLILLLKPYRVGDFIEAQGYTGTVKAIQIFNTVINTIDNKAIIIPNGGLSTGSINNYSMESYRRVDWTVGLSYDTDFDAARKVILQMLADDHRVVKQYIEDDRIMRLEEEMEKHEGGKGTTSEPQEEEKIDTNHKLHKSWWSAYRERRRQRELKDKMYMPEPVADELHPVVARKDCSPFVALDEMAASSINIKVWAWTRSQDYWGLYYAMNERFYRELPRHGFSFPFPQLDVHVSETDS